MKRTRTYERIYTHGLPVVDDCKTCLQIDLTYNTCMVFLDPAYQFRNGKQCWGRCDDPKEMIDRLKKMYDYSQGENRSIAEELTKWRKYQKEKTEDAKNV